MRESVKKQLPSTKKADNRKDKLCEDNFATLQEATVQKASKYGRTKTDATLGNIPLNMEMLQQSAILRKTFQTLKKAQSES